MNKTNLFSGALILSAVFLLGCSSNDPNDPSEPDKPSSSSTPSSSSGGGNTVEDQRLIRNPITLSLDSSYADIDVPIAYTKDDAANNVSKIDLVAHCGTDMGCKKPSIYNPYEIDGGDLFWNSTYIGSWIYFFEIPSDQSEIFRTANRLYQILPTYNSLASAGLLSGYGVEEISIEADKVFYVVTSEEHRSFVIIKKVNSQSVDLEIFEVPKGN